MDSVIAGHTQGEGWWRWTPGILSQVSSALRWHVLTCIRNASLLLEVKRKVNSKQESPLLFQGTQKGLRLSILWVWWGGGGGGGGEGRLKSGSSACLAGFRRERERQN